EPASVAVTLSTAPLGRRLSSSLALSKGSGQFRPLASSSASQAGACCKSVISHLETMSGRAYPSLATAGQRRRERATVSASLAASTRMTAARPTLFMLAFCLALSPAVQANDLPSLGDASSAIVAPEQEYQLGRAW